VYWSSIGLTFSIRCGCRASKAYLDELIKDHRLQITDHRLQITDYRITD